MEIQHSEACQQINIPQGKAECCIYLEIYPLRAVIFTCTNIGGALSGTYIAFLVAISLHCN